ncbi:MAG: zinc ABC transporter substrate-binding protein [Rhabdochlamydiaceae bacterium]|nr:zinc ABC transporter substrate-binding protein [Rhabdochlamydiaceae bacterium]
MEKGIICLFCALLGGCSTASQEPPPPLSKMMKVLSTTAMIGDLVAKVGGERVQGGVLIMGEIDPHSYELVKGDDEKINEASVVFFSGLNLEHGASLRHKLSLHPHAISLGDTIRKELPNRILLEQGQVDPHIWMDISLWSYAIEPISQALSAQDPEGKAYYAQRAHEAFLELMKSHEMVRAQMQKIPEEKRYLVTSHDAFAYFTRAYLSTDEEFLTDDWKKRMAAPEGFAPEGQLGAADLQKIIDYLIQHRGQVVFPESNVSPDALRKIVSACKEKGMNIHISPESLYGDSMGPPGSMAGSYPGMVEYDAMILQNEWK